MSPDVLDCALEDVSSADTDAWENEDESEAADLFPPGGQAASHRSNPVQLQPHSKDLIRWSLYFAVCLSVWKRWQNRQIPEHADVARHQIKIVVVRTDIHYIDICFKPVDLCQITVKRNN